MKPLLPSVYGYADRMETCGAWAIARMMYKQGLDISLALLALRQTVRYTRPNYSHKYGWLMRGFTRV